MSGKLAAVLVLSVGSFAYSQVYVYECDVLPPDAGWTLFQNVCGLTEWIDNSTLIEQAGFCPPPNQDQGQQIDYIFDIGSFLGVNAMFFEWRVRSTGDRSELNFSAPSAFVMNDGGGVTYHFTMASDQIRYIRDDNDPWVYIDIAPGVPHTYRVELFDVDWFTVFIDGAVVDDGVPEGTLMQFDPVVAIRTKAQFGPSTTTWDYMRWGVIPADASGDFDSGAAADAFDLFYFSECVDRSAAGEPADPSCQWADFNADNTVDCVDAVSFTAIYAGDPSDLGGFDLTPCTPIPTVSDWGVAILTLLILGVGTIAYQNREVSKSAS